MRLSSGALTLGKMCLDLFAEGGKQKLDINSHKRRLLKNLPILN
jgi:hypothetical protein